MHELAGASRKVGLLAGTGGYLLLAARLLQSLDARVFLLNLHAQMI